MLPIAPDHDTPGIEVDGGGAIIVELLSVMKKLPVPD